MTTSSKDTHSKNAPPVKESPPQQRNPSPNLQDTSDDEPSPTSSPPKTASATPTSDPSVVQPVVRPTETLPVEARGPDENPRAVKHARHAETPEQLAKLEIYEHSKVPPPGSRNYVAGQPVNEEERDATEKEAANLAQTGAKHRREAEKRSQEMAPGGGYHPVDPDYPDPDQRRDTADFGRGDTNGDKDKSKDKDKDK